MTVKFTPIEMKPLYNLGRSPVGWHPALADGLAEMPAGGVTLRGVPFALGPVEGPCWLVLDPDTPPVVVPLSGLAAYLMVAHFCDLPSGKGAASEPGFITQPGEAMARYTLIYHDGSEHAVMIRRRFEIGNALRVWGQEAFACLPHTVHQPVHPETQPPLHKWGWYQSGMTGNPTPGTLLYWIYALPNPEPVQELAGLRISSIGVGRFAVAGVTLYHGRKHPLRLRPLETLRVSGTRSVQDVPVALDLGVIARRSPETPLDLPGWLDSQAVGLGDVSSPPDVQATLFLEVSSHPEATLAVGDDLIELEPVFDGERAVGGSGVEVEVVSGQKAWLHAVVLDAATGLPTPARISFRTADGRYFPPYGHRHEVNADWFEDYGGDLKLGATPYAYVDGRFQVELPVGEVFAETVKGFEYQPVRQRLWIEPGQRELSLQIRRASNWREQGWVTADTHVHFLSPQTAWLEARAEGVNLVNLLASQWGDLFTNVADLTGEASGVSRDDTLVWVGTENRQHVLGHISLLAAKGAPIFPMAVAGPDESYFGDPVSIGLSEWAEHCREREGLVVLPHFPQPYCEAAADIVLGKIDAVEIANFYPGVDSTSVREWYRYLNCGYRVAAVGGTDKMSAGIPVGGVRTYALLEGEPFGFDAWKKAVRSGRTFTTTGPLVSLSVEGCGPGEVIRLPVDGGTLEVEASVQSVYPVHELQVVVNGRVVVSEEADSEGRSVQLREKLHLLGSAWIAARCSSPLLAQHHWQANHLAAHTSPVYVTCGEGELFNLPDATFMLTLIEGGLTWLDTLSVPPAPERATAVREVFIQAQHHLSGRLDRHTHPHYRGPE